MPLSNVYMDSMALEQSSEMTEAAPKALERSNSTSLTSSYALGGGIRKSAQLKPTIDSSRTAFSITVFILSAIRSVTRLASLRGRVHYKQPSSILLRECNAENVRNKSSSFSLTSVNQKRQQFGNAFGLITLALQLARNSPLWSLLVLTVLIVPVAAIDDQIVFAPYRGHYINAVPGLAPAPYPPAGMIGLTSTLLMIALGFISSLANMLLGPLMGISSVLWFIMRNDTAVKPIFSWTIFGIWSLMTLMYLLFQTRRVTLDGLYILLTLTFSGVCLCIIALVQKASIQGGLVTAIPPCTSFAAYAVAFFFPDRRYSAQHSLV